MTFKRSSWKVLEMDAECEGMDVWGEWWRRLYTYFEMGTKARVVTWGWERGRTRESVTVPAQVCRQSRMGARSEELGGGRVDSGKDSRAEWHGEWKVGWTGWLRFC